MNTTQTLQKTDPLNTLIHCNTLNTHTSLPVVPAATDLLYYGEKKPHREKEKRGEWVSEWEKERREKTEKGLLNDLITVSAGGASTAISGGRIREERRRRKRTVSELCTSTSHPSISQSSVLICTHFISLFSIHSFLHAHPNSTVPPFLNFLIDRVL